MIRPCGVLIPGLASLLLLASCSSSNDSQNKTGETAKPAATQAAPTAETPATGDYKVLMATSKGDITIEVHRDWAPIGAQRFYDLVQSGFYDNARFFRYVPNFIIQFGLAADPAVTKKWDKNLADDPVTHTNRAGSVTFATAGPNTRTTQVFFNLRSNQSLDEQGFAPFAQIVDGMDVTARIYSGYGEQPDQDAIQLQGNAYLLKSYPKLDYIKTAKVI
jgi:peptidyl-prolyl cis-trans isomerase A (cyclophilin A)